MHISWRKKRVYKIFARIKSSYIIFYFHLLSSNKMITQVRGFLIFSKMKQSNIKTIVMRNVKAIECACFLPWYILLPSTYIGYSSYWYEFIKNNCYFGNIIVPYRFWKWWKNLSFNLIIRKMMIYNCTLNHIKYSKFLMPNFWSFR